MKIFVIRWTDNKGKERVTKVRAVDDTVAWSKFNRKYGYSLETLWSIDVQRKNKPKKVKKVKDLKTLEDIAVALANVADEGVTVEIYGKARRLLDIRSGWATVLITAESKNSFVAEGPGLPERWGDAPSTYRLVRRFVRN